MTKAPPPPQRVLYTVSEVADILHKHVQTVRLMHKRGELPYVQSGIYKLTTAEQLDRYIAEHSSD